MLACLSRCCLPLFAAGVLMPAHAAPPMNTDDAATLGQGGMKLEGVWRKDAKELGGALRFGFSPLENLELEVAAFHARNRADDPASRFSGAAFGAKWAPWQNESGWSLGARFDHSRGVMDPRLDEVRSTRLETALTGLVTYRWPDGQALHANLGVMRIRAPEEKRTAGAWSLGGEWPLAEKTRATLEIFGQSAKRPDKALGVRHEIGKGFYLHAAAGRGNDRSFGQAGLAWEF